MAQDELPIVSDIDKQRQQPINVPLIYTNGVTVSLTLTDLHLTAQVNGRPACVLAIPLPAAKSLMQSLSQAIDDYEKKTETYVMDLDELTSKLLK
jgi:hypothetical protein